MKKFIISLIAGAVLIGAGIGVLFVEVAEFTVADCLPYIAEDKIDTFTFEDNEVFVRSKGNPVKIDMYLGEYFMANGNVLVVEDAEVDGVEITIDYHGNKPKFSFYDASYGEIYGEEYVAGYTLYSYQNHYLPKDIMDALKYMCQNKVLVENFDTYCIEKVVIKTSSPNLIEIIK